MIQHGHSLQDIMDIMNECYMDDESREYTTPSTYYEDFLDTGFQGEIFCSFEEFLNAEYLNGNYMHSILTAEEFTTWRDDTEQYDLYSDLSVQTSKGNINVKVVPGNYPGILVECETKDSVGNPGALMEYDCNSKKFMLRVYGGANPDGEPIANYQLSK